jgi:hypothetical protein
METTITLNEYEKEALLDSIAKQIQQLEDQSKDIMKMKHGSSDDKKEFKRTLTKRINLLQEILKKIK